MMQKPEVKLKASLEPVENTGPWIGSPTSTFHGDNSTTQNSMENKCHSK